MIPIKIIDVLPGYCQCGCGVKTEIIKYGDKSKGWKVGEYKRFIFGHYPRGRTHSQSTRELLSRNFHDRVKRPEDHPSWKNGTKLQRGYVYIKDKDNPNSDKQGYVKRCVVVMQKKMGRPLKPWVECVHHIDENRLNDDINNLLLCTRGEHNKIHNKRRRGNASI